MNENEMKVVETQEIVDEKPEPNRIQVRDSKLEAVERLQCITQDVQDSAAMIPRAGYEYRNRLIEEAPDLEWSVRLRESYRNDDHELEMQRRAAEVGNSIRTNKTKCVAGVCISFGLAALAKPIGKAIASSVRRKDS